MAVMGQKRRWRRPFQVGFAPDSRHVVDGRVWPQRARSDMKKRFARLMRPDGMKGSQHNAECAQPAAGRSPACRRWAASYSL
jgi:hypothetical protein